MITIRCTQLEQVRQSPLLYVESILNGNNPNNGGSHGMLACMKDVVKTIHTHERNINQAVGELQNKFSRFANTINNKKRQEQLIEQMIVYNSAFDNMGFEMVDGHRQIKWNIVPDARLSGFTPWVVEDKNGLLFAYFIVEKSFDWASELRFPLYQSYISTNTHKCDISDLQVGIFDLSTNKFEFENFTSEEITDVINETSNIVSKVVTEFQKKKK